MMIHWMKVRHKGLVDHSHIKSTGHTMVSGTLCETSKGIAEVVDFLQNDGLW